MLCMKSLATKLGLGALVRLSALDGVLCLRRPPSRELALPSNPTGYLRERLLRSALAMENENFTGDSEPARGIALLHVHQLPSVVFFDSVTMPRTERATNRVDSVLPVPETVHITCSGLCLPRTL
ncbi:hypothetical protein FA95DRAFT_891879 [Auriscalpium vulgare]|uniref:Uncharacterized protein n=1 Tax=Auriscalpium vulgare TaxID=40419 RepID=A0ACB8RYS3_9AGAM|nr:hypothetical protein FA95DRAFT_891879 [Auriscalpium vulgare]